ncbi:MAG: SNF2-related protein [Solirubrobacteraceae bacterium]
MHAPIAELVAFDLEEVRDAVGETSFKRGRSYATSKRVLSFQWHAEEDALTGVVVGNGAIYEVTAYFQEDPREYIEGECTCPMGWNCKHVAALVVAAAGHAAPGRSAASRQPASASPRRSSSAAPAPAPPSWERSLRALLPSGQGSAPGEPLAVALTLQPSGPGANMRVLAKLMRRGARGGWINGSLSWSSLEPWSLRGAPLRDDHIDVARQLHEAHRSATMSGRYSYASYSYGAEKQLDCTAIGPQLWTLLDLAQARGIEIFRSDHASATVRCDETAVVVIDVTRTAADGLAATARLALDGETAPDLRIAGFLGDAGHGALCLEGENGPMHLVRLRKPVPAKLQQMVMDGARLDIPAADVDAFTTELCPALGAVAPIVSADGSFTAPEVSAPRLTLRAAYGEQHALSLGWAWTYRIGDQERRVSLQVGAEQGFRDHVAERQALTQLALPDLGHGLLDAAGRPAPGDVVLHGSDTMRATAEVLPALAAVDGVVVDVTGEPADYRDVGEFVEIGVSTAEIEGDQDWFDLGVSIRVEGLDVPFAEVFTALATGQSTLLLDDGAHFSLLEPRLQSLRALIEEARALSDAPDHGLRLSRYQAGLWAELAALGVVTEQAAAWERQVEALHRLDALTDYEPPATLTAQLREYQLEGFRWLATLWDLGLGGILADDMGLGKTVQVLAMMLHARERDPDAGPFLVVAPTSVVPGWVAEAARFAPELRVSSITDTLRRSGRTLDEAVDADLVVTTYTLCRLEAEALATVPWAAVALDEAQFVKNHQAKTYRCVRELPARCKLAITGTPMENNLMELWALLSITAPGLFPDPARFGEQYSRPIERQGDTERLARLRQRIKPLVKRRTKELVAADLPPKQEQTLDIELHPGHRKLYDTQLQRERQKILGLLDDLNRNRLTILRSLTILRQLSLHPVLVDDKHHAVPCAKLTALTEQLDEVVAGGHRALVFSQFTGFLGLVRDHLDRHGIGYRYLDGRTRNRAEVLGAFKDGDDPVFLISLKAGGFGLNLTEADYCFLLDPWWNPAAEAQAIDRTHRIGQQRSVMVYRMIATGTIEEKVRALAERKAALFRGVMDDGDLFSSKLTADDIRELLG